MSAMEEEGHDTRVRGKWRGNPSCIRAQGSKLAAHSSQASLKHASIIHVLSLQSSLCCCFSCINQRLRHTLELALALIANPGQLHFETLLLIVHLVQATGAREGDRCGAREWQAQQKEPEPTLPAKATAMRTVQAQRARSATTTSITSSDADTNFAVGLL